MREQELEALIKPVVEAMGYEYVGLELNQQVGTLLRLYIDSKAGVTCDDCAAVSRQLSATLDVEDPIEGAYSLEVSSPGLERPLFKIEHYQAQIGKTLNVKLKEMQEGRKNFKGELQAVEGDNIRLLVENQEFTFALSDIQKAKLVLDL